MTREFKTQPMITFYTAAEGTAVCHISDVQNYFEIEGSVTANSFQGRRATTRSKIRPKTNMDGNG